MKWEKNHTLNDGESWGVETDLGEFTLRLEDNRLHYSRPALEDHGEDDPVEKTFIMDSLDDSVSVDFTPLYPDRPVIFKLEDSLNIPPGENGFFCVPLRVGLGFTLTDSETPLEQVTPSPRKNAYWGPPNDGILAYQEPTELFTKPPALMRETETATAVVPIYYNNRRDEESEVDRCLVPLRELDLYRNDSDDLIYEVVKLTHYDPFYQEPEPFKRPPKEIRQDVTFFLEAPESAKSLFDKVKSMPRLTNIGSVFMNR